MSDRPPRPDTPGVPARAEYITASDYRKERSRPSDLIPGKLLYWTDFHCPRCGKESAAEHGEPVTHDCGLSWVCYGNGLYVWETK